jgi:hypothetical protein
VETALRGGVVYIASDLIPYSTGIDLTELLLLMVFGEKDRVKTILNKTGDSKAAAYLSFLLKKGIITDIKGVDEILDIEGVQMTEIENLKIGDKIPPFIHKGMRQGPFIIFSNKAEDIKDIVNKIKENFIIEIDYKNGIIWK